MHKTKHFCVYIVASRSRAIHIGVSSDLMLRMHQHRSRTTQSHASRYRIDRLVWFEAAGDAMSAIAREKQLKGWRREKKIHLIEAQNPTWEDLAAPWFAPSSTIRQRPLEPEASNPPRHPEPAAGR